MMILGCNQRESLLSNCFLKTIEDKNEVWKAVALEAGYKRKKGFSRTVVRERISLGTILQRLSLRWEIKSFTIRSLGANAQRNILYQKT